MCSGNVGLFVMIPIGLSNTVNSPFPSGSSTIDFPVASTAIKCIGGVSVNGGYDSFVTFRVFAIVSTSATFFAFWSKYRATSVGFMLIFFGEGFPYLA
ncbi:hypothetical protein NY2A_b372R [Paramecium bursaria Chlorella virus NY2A]|uniref:Uncharacterized protein b372R n=1 Tax=Paramecium bursaria Chlorella virus NY2A TaxID=46021 RepID=A7IWP7_PBCVN|nr:hypothetical protein NY2A_b372R [Paramecium bursaria Chlorella virus NY2A]ABT14771.1 hypothetical protein NY2A_b372R [Paramecium bursaria Chlorella virus NY2A]